MNKRQIIRYYQSFMSATKNRVVIHRQELEGDDIGIKTDVARTSHLSHVT